MTLGGRAIPSANVVAISRGDTNAMPQRRRGHADASPQRRRGDTDAAPQRRRGDTDATPVCVQNARWAPRATNATDTLRMPYVFLTFALREICNFRRDDDASVRPNVILM